MWRTPRSPQFNRVHCGDGNTASVTHAFGDTSMTSMVLPSFDVASLVAHLVMVGFGLLLLGLALRMRNTTVRLSGVLMAVALLATPLLLADGWIERGLLAFWA